MDESVPDCVEDFALHALSRSLRYAAWCCDQIPAVSDIVVFCSKHDSEVILFARVFSRNLKPIDVVPPAEEKGEQISQLYESDRKRQPMDNRMFCYAVVQQNSADSPVTYRLLPPVMF
jgi:hypothetical protein